MKAGRELDALVAEKVMGWEVVNYQNIGVVDLITDDDTFELDGFQPSTDISDAWKVVEWIKNIGFNFFLGNGDTGEYDCIFVKPHAPKMCRSQDETMPITICMAALKAVGVDVE